MSASDDNGPGFRVTLKDVYTKLEQIESSINDRLRKVEVQIAAQWVVVGIVIVGLGALLARTLQAN